MNDSLPAEQIQSRIRLLRGQRVLLDADLAALYGVNKKRLNEQVHRNQERFPDDFCFQLTREEFANLKSQFATSSGSHGGLRKLPFAFTEHGALMAANVLSSTKAIQMSLVVIRAFVGLRQLFATHKALSAKLDELDARVGEHDKHLAAIIEAIRLLTTPDAPEHGRKIGFHND
jgi:ORF6N domain